jgi:hypothetical protein
MCSDAGRLNLLTEQVELLTGHAPASTAVAWRVGSLEMLELRIFHSCMCVTVTVTVTGNSLVSREQRR